MRPALAVGLIAVLLAAVAPAQPPKEPPPKPKLAPERAAELTAEIRKLMADGNKLLTAGKLSDAAPILEKVVTAQEALLGELADDPINNRQLLARLRELVEQFDAAKKERERIAELQAKRFGKDDWRVTDTRLAIRHIELLAKMGADDRAELRRAAEAFRSGAAASRKGEHEQALQWRLQARDIRKMVLGEDHPDYADSLDALGAQFHRMGQPAKAEPLFLQARDIRKKVLGEGHPDYAAVSNNLGLLYLETGQLAKAEGPLLQARDIQKKAHGENHPGYASILTNVGNMYEALGQPAKAEQPLLQACFIRKNELGDDHPEYGAALGNLGLLYARTGQPAKAEAVLLLARDTLKEALGEKHPDYAKALGNLGMVYGALEQPAKAEPLLLQVRDIQKKVLGEGHPDLAATFNNLGQLYRQLGQPSKAEAYFSDAVKVVSAHLDAVAEIQTEADQLAAAAAHRNYRDNLLDGTAKSSSAAVYEPLFRLRGAVTLRQTFARAARQAKPETKPLVARLQAVTRELSRLANSPPDPKSGLDIPKRMTELTEQYEKLQRELADQSDAFGEYRKRKTATVADFRKLIPADAAVIDFLAYKDRLCAFVVTAQGVKRFELGESAPVAEAVDRFRSQLNRSAPVTGRKDDPAVFLRDALLAPLAKELAGKKRLLVCPDGALCRLPFAALPAADGTKYLLEDTAVVLLPVPQQLFDLMAPAGEKPAPAMLAMGDVDFDTATADPDAKHLRAGGPQAWKALPGTKSELVAVRDLFAAGHPKGELVELSGTQATTAALRANLPQSRFVHLGTHGFFSPKELTAKPKPKGKDDGMTSFDRPQGPKVNPGVLSGIVCAGANKSDREGVLTALDLAELDLVKVELAVLSACETGLGEVAGGEGVFGLQRALHLAGTRSAITSLWKVPDQATQVLMARFYRNLWEKKMPKLDALREAQLWMLTDGSHDPGVKRERGAAADVPAAEIEKGGRLPPYFWAAFALSGDWR